MTSINQGIFKPMGGEKSGRHEVASSPTSCIFDAWAGKEVAVRAETSLWEVLLVVVAKDNAACTGLRIMVRRKICANRY